MAATPALTRPTTPRVAWRFGWLRHGWMLAIAAALLATSLGAGAATMPNGGRVVSITAREQPIAAFLQDLFATTDVPASIAPNVAGSVNGSFSGPAAKVLRDVARVYNLITYYDGAVMHVVPAADLTRRTYAASPALSERLMRDVMDLDLTDTRNTVRRSADGNMIAVGARRFVEQVDELVRAAQAQKAAPAATSSGADFRVFYLRYAWAHDVTMTIGGRQVVVPGVASILRSLVDSRPSRPLGRETLIKPTQPSLRGQGLAGQGVTEKSIDKPADKATIAEAVRNDQVDRLVNALSMTAQPGAEAEQAQTTSPDYQQIRIQADQRLNAVIVRDSAERLPRYEQLIASLDVEPQSLEIEATIIDVNVDKARELGINWRFNNNSNGNEASFGGAVAATGLGGAATVVLGSVQQFIGRIRALQTEGAARIVSSPQVVTLSDVEAVFDNSQTFYVRVAGRTDVDLFNVSAGTSLRVTPHVFRDRQQTRIKLLVNVEDGNISNRQVDQIPVVERSTVNTQALIAEGESLLIGGMVRETTTNSTDKVPGLGDVPVVGNLFKTRANSTVRVERMFLITPRIAGTRTAAATSSLGTLRAGATAVDAPAPEPTPLPSAAKPTINVNLDMPARPAASPVAPLPVAPVTPVAPVVPIVPATPYVPVTPTSVPAQPTVTPVMAPAAAPVSNPATAAASLAAPAAAAAPATAPAPAPIGGPAHRKSVVLDL